MEAFIGNTHQLIPAAEKPISSNTSPTPAKDSTTTINRHEWTAFVIPSQRRQAHEEVYLKQVTFKLHPTFSPSSATIVHGEEESEKPFEVTRLGWGTFEIQVVLTWSNGFTAHAKHELNFEANRCGRTVSFRKEQSPGAAAATEAEVEEAAVQAVDKEAASASLEKDKSPTTNNAIAAVAEQKKPVVLPRAPFPNASPWHGYWFDPSAPEPKCVCRSDEVARPGYSKVKASEFLDSPAVLQKKVDLLAAMIESSQNFCLYSGAGLSTAAGIPDYASRGKGSMIGKSDCINHLQLQPTHAHRVLAALEKRGHLKHWLQQNHDGLAQKAGYPFEKLNEIHGTWFNNKANPVVAMSGNLRGDLFQWMLDWEERADLTVAVGTSMCGMNADRVAQSTSARHMNENLGFGLVIINLQQTPYDDKSSLRIFAKSDDVFGLLAKKMKLRIDPKTYCANVTPEQQKWRYVSPKEQERKTRKH